MRGRKWGLTVPTASSMLLFLCLLLPALSPSSQEICSAPGALSAPILYLNQTLAQPGDIVLFQCSAFSQFLATHVVFCKDREEVSSQKALEEKITYDYVHVVSGGSSGNYTCWYEIKDSNNQVTRSQLSPARHLSVTGDDSSSGGDGGSFLKRLALSPAVWAARCLLVLLLLVSAPVITFVLDKQGLPQPSGLTETPGGSGRISGEGSSGRSPFTAYEQEDG